MSLQVPIHDFSPQAALHLALACQACYSGSPDEIEAVTGAAPNKVHSSAVEDQFVEVCQFPDSTLIVFRGTASLGGWIITDGDARLREFAGLPGLVHHGFASAFGQLAGWVARLTDRYTPVVVTGHSLGGALATLCAQFLAGRGYGVAPVYTFGSPRVGNADFAAAYTPTQFRLVNDDDPVPWLPAGWGYRHVGEERWIDADGTIRPVGLRRFFGGLWSRVLARDVKICADHLIAAYVEALQRGLPTGKAA